jgi:hypothetical protein
MGFVDFCKKTRWWTLILGLFTLSFGIGLILIVFSIIGFANNRSSSTRNEYMLPVGFDYPDKVKREDFARCPVCKKGEIETDAEKPSFSTCIHCKAQFRFVGDSTYTVSVKGCEDEYKKFQYANCSFHVNEWNMIALTNRTLRETVLEQFREGEVPRSQADDAPVTLKSKEHVVWSEQSELHEPRAVRQYGGGSVRVAKGTYVHLGRAESHQEMRHIDSGVLTLTNKRLVFSGGTRSSNIDLRKVINTSVYSDGFKVTLENRQKPQFFATNDPEFWYALLIGTMKNLS